jgi:hypothetical protein
MVLQETAWLAAIGIGAGLAAATAVHAISRFDALRSEGDRSSYARGTGFCLCLLSQCWQAGDQPTEQR